MVLFADSNCLSGTSDQVLNCFDVFLQAIEVATTRNITVDDSLDIEQQTRIPLINEGQRLEDGIRISSQPFSQMHKTAEDYMQEIQKTNIPAPNLNSINQLGKLTCPSTHQPYQDVTSL